jgi:hypothetical protein
MNQASSEYESIILPICQPPWSSYLETDFRQPFNDIRSIFIGGDL